MYSTRLDNSRCTWLRQRKTKASFATGKKMIHFVYKMDLAPLMLTNYVPFIAGCQREPERREEGREHRDPANGHPRRAIVPARSGNQLRLDNFLRYPSCRTNGRSHHRPRFQVLGQKIQFWATFLAWAE